MTQAKQGLLSRLLNGSTDNIFVQLFRYTFVGGAAFVADFGSLWVLTDFAGLHYQLSAAIAFVIGLTLNYVLSTRWVFDSAADAYKTRSVKVLQFVLYAVIGVVGLALNAAIMWVFTGLLAVHYLASKLISTVIVFVWNFLARRVLMKKTAEQELSKMDARTQ
ncbi:MAG: GtrA family protein [Muribaculaceae bacterium]|nr:GtrA family protein [Muribaculaceae bacterium]